MCFPQISSKKLKKVSVRETDGAKNESLGVKTYLFNLQNRLFYTNTLTTIFRDLDILPTKLGFPSKPKKC